MPRVLARPHDTGVTLRSPQGDLQAVEQYLASNGQKKAAPMRGPPEHRAGETSCADLNRRMHRIRAFEIIVKNWLRSAK
jgi:hypothetical protein